MEKPTYKIVRNLNGDRAVRLENGTTIPAAIARSSCGPNKWLSEIKCKCRDCGEVFLLRDLGETGQRCEFCLHIVATYKWMGDSATATVEND